MSFSYAKTVRFQETDAAGVVYFAKALAMCHDAYEASLAASGINIKVFFECKNLILPIVHASIDFYRPMFCGDQLAIQVTPQQLRVDEFEVAYQMFVKEDVTRCLVKAKTRHVCIHPVNRIRKPLSEELMEWLKFCEG